MTIWVVRAGRYGEREEQALEEECVFIGWGDLSDLSRYSDKEALKSALEKVYPDDSKPGRIMNHAGQLFTFSTVMRQGDIIALPLKNRPAIAFGKITGPYTYKPDNGEGATHCRPVKWLGEPILRSRFDQDLQYSFGGAMTVFSVHRNDAEKRIKHIISHPATKDVAIQTDEDISEPAPNVIDVASRQISDYIGRKFKGRKLEILVEAILKAQGYETNLCPEGADGGVDILAGKGTMGFGNPRLCVQVKSGNSPVGREVLDQLKGVMSTHQADHGLLVSWGGFKNTVIREARREFFNIRLWNDQKLVTEIQAVYDTLPKDIQADLPLQQTWALVEDE